MALVLWEYGLVIAGGNPVLANVHPNNSAVEVLKHFRIIFPEFGGLSR